VDVAEVKKLDAYLSKLFGNPNIRVVPKKGDVAEVFVGEDDLGELTVDDEDGDRSFNFRMVIQVSSDPSFQPLPALTAYLRGKFDNENIRVVMRPKKTDSVEAYIGDEFLGVLFAENEKGRRSYIFELPILDVDLDGGPVVVDDYPGTIAGRKLAISRSMPSATLRQSSSQARGKRTVRSAPPMRRSCRHMAGVDATWRVQRSRKRSGAAGSRIKSSPWYGEPSRKPCRLSPSVPAIGAASA
jgi:hypothetical protein